MVDFGSKALLDPIHDSVAAEGFEGYNTMEYEAFAGDFPKDQDKVLSGSEACLDELVKKHWGS